jgi:hypothetical protein
MPAGGPHNARDSCAICDHSIEGVRLTDTENGRAFHPQCVVERLPQDAIVRVLGVLALVVVPTVVVWAA